MWHLECKTCYLQDVSKRTFDADKVTVDTYSSSDREVARGWLKRVERLCGYLYALVAVGHDLCGYKKFMQDTYLLSELPCKSKKILFNKCKEITSPRISYAH